MALTGAKLHEVMAKLAEFETMSIGDLHSAGSSHDVAVRLLTREAKRRLEEIERDDLDELYSFRIQARERVWCVKHENIMLVLWWDPNHEVYAVRQRRR